MGRRVNAHELREKGGKVLAKRDNGEIRKISIYLDFSVEHFY
jgi:hypothetical protein